MIFVIGVGAILIIGFYYNYKTHGLEAAAYYAGMIVLIVVMILGSGRAEAIEIQVQSGNGFQRAKWAPQKDMIGFKLDFENVYVSFLDIDTVGVYSSSGIKTNNKYYQASIGFGTIDSRGDDYLSGNAQFDLYIGGIAKINKKLRLHYGWRHISNCRHVCKRFYKRNAPNIGLDWFMIALGFVL